MPAPPRDPPAPRGPLVLGTAGHVDHGRAAPLGVLTGTGTDRRPEAPERGIAVALGHVRLERPSSRVGGALPLVDLPGPPVAVGPPGAPA